MISSVLNRRHLQIVDLVLKISRLALIPLLRNYLSTELINCTAKSVGELLAKFIRRRDSRYSFYILYFCSIHSQKTSEIFIIHICLENIGS